MKTTHMAIALLLLVAVGCVRVSTTGGAGSSRTGGLESPTVVRYHVAGFGAAEAGDYLAAPADIDKFFALGTNSVPGAGGAFDAPLATVFHRGRVSSLVSPTNVWAPFDLLVVENGRILMTVPDGACHLSSSVPAKCVEPDRKAPATASLEQVLRLREKGKETDVPLVAVILASNLPPVRATRTLRSNLSAQEFAAALRGRWESVFALPGSTNIVHAEFRADDTAVVVVAASDAVRTNTGPYRLEFERPPSSNMVTLARITMQGKQGEWVLLRVNFGLHNGVHERRLLLRIDGNPHGALDRALPWGEAVERVQEGPRTVKPAWSEVSEGLRGRLVIAQPRVPARGRLVATLEMENVGKTQLVVRTQNPFDFEARVPDAAGLDIPPTSIRSDVLYTGKFVAIPAGERLSLPVTIESQDGAKGSQVDTTTDIWTLAPGRYGLGGTFGMAVMEEKAPRGTWVGRLTLPVVPFEIAAVDWQEAKKPDTGADLPGTERSLIEIAGTTRNVPPWVTPVVVRCRALTEGQVQVGYSSVNHVMQEFLQLEPIVGKEELRPGTGEVFRLHYNYLAPPQFKQRPIRKGEEVFWVIEQLAKMGDFSALKALTDTPENRAAVQEVFGELTLEKRRAVLLEALGERTPMGAEMEHRLRWVLCDVRHFSAKFRRGAVPADTAGAERAADGRHYVRTAITLDRLAGGPVPENWVRQLTTHIAQGNRVEELEIRVADPVASTWVAMIRAMQAGDKAALAKTCTEKGYRSIMKGYRNKETGAKDLQSWGWAWSNLPLLSRRQTAASVMLRMGSDVKTFGFEFDETPDGWKLDQYHPGK
jgi:hypothetical protein